MAAVAAATPQTCEQTWTSSADSDLADKDVAEMSAEECERHAGHHRPCAICAEACRGCARACGVLLEDEAFEELQELAGG